MHRHLKNVLINVSIAIFVLGVLWHRSTVKKLNRRIETLETKLQGIAIARLHFGLRVPSEALYYDDEYRAEIREVRLRHYKKNGVEKIWTYSPGPIDSYLDDYPTLRAMSVPECSLDDGVSGSFEHWWLNNASYAVSQLKTDFIFNQGLGPYFQEHPEQFEGVVEPWVLRMTKALHPAISLPACELLLYKGDRSQEVLDAIQRAIEGERDPSTAMKLNKEYQLGLKRTEEDK